MLTPADHDTRDAIGRLLGFAIRAPAAEQRKDDRPAIAPDAQRPSQIGVDTRVVASDSAELIAEAGDPPTREDAPLPESSLPLLSATGTDDRPLAAPWRAVSTLEPFDATRHLDVLPRRIPLFDARWVRTLLAALLHTPRYDGPLDESAAVSALAQGRALDPIPRLPRRTLSGGVQVLVDLGEGMQPFWHDSWDVARRMERLMGESTVQTMTFWDAPLRGIGPSGATYPLPDIGAPVLAISDLGIGGPSLRADRARADEWLRFAQRLRVRRSEVVVLVPYSRDRWPDGLTREITLVEWDRSTTAASVHAMRPPRSARTGNR